MTFLEYKSKDAGLDYIKVNEAYTSQKNCLTGKKEFKSDLSIREVELMPGLVVDRDLNSAINIAKKHLGDWSPQASSFNLTKMILNARSSLIDLKDGGLNEFYNFL
jgi:transposase